MISQYLVNVSTSAIHLFDSLADGMPTYTLINNAGTLFLCLSFSEDWNLESRCVIQVTGPDRSEAAPEPFDH
jgi:hypothetical protein